jgi:hypothetical protein
MKELAKKIVYPDVATAFLILKQMPKILNNTIFSKTYFNKIGINP